VSPSSLIATWFGSGLIKPAPGTWGTLAALPFAWGMATWGESMGIPWALAVAAIALFPIGVWAAGRHDALNGGHDSSEIVVDEVVGVWVALAFVPADWVHYIAGFLLFRLFDIWKPWPIRWADQAVDGGLGVMLDDVFAGVAAALSLWGIGALIVLATASGGTG
jgi:phosphatidylglycerophosphatase A